MQAPERERLVWLLRRGGLLVAAGLIYAFLAGRFGGIPCVFRLITGLKCPGCGVTRMCLHLLHGDVLSAFHDNGAVFLMLVPGLLLFFRWCRSYVMTGERRLSPGANRMAVVAAVLLVSFGIARNAATVWGLSF